MRPFEICASRQYCLNSVSSWGISGASVSGASSVANFMISTLFVDMIQPARLTKWWYTFIRPLWLGGILCFVSIVYDRELVFAGSLTVFSVPVSGVNTRTFSSYFFLVYYIICYGCFGCS